MHKEYIAIEGKEFIIEWYFNKQRKSQAKSYLERMPKKEQIAAVKLLQLFANIGQIRDKTKFRFEGDHIYAFKTGQN